MKPAQIKTNPHYITTKPHRVRHPPKPDKNWHYLAGAIAFDMNSYDHIDQPNANDEYIENALVPAAGAHCCTIPNPAEVMEQKSTKESLSEEALFVLDLILNAPLEILELISSEHRHTITLTRIAKHLRNTKGWDITYIEQTFKELKTYVGAL